MHLGEDTKNVVVSYTIQQTLTDAKNRIMDSLKMGCYNHRQLQERYNENRVDVTLELLKELPTDDQVAAKEAKEQFVQALIKDGYVILNNTKAIKSLVQKPKKIVDWEAPATQAQIDYLVHGLFMPESEAAKLTKRQARFQILRRTNTRVRIC